MLKYIHSLFCVISSEIEFSCSLRVCSLNILQKNNIKSETNTRPSDAWRKCCWTFSHAVKFTKKISFVPCCSVSLMRFDREKEKKFFFGSKTNLSIFYQMILALNILITFASAFYTHSFIHSFTRRAERVRVIRFLEGSNINFMLKFLN